MTTNTIIAQDLELIHGADIDWKVFKNKTVLISGAGGFLPAYMVEALLYANYLDKSLNLQVVALVRNLPKAHHRFKDYLNNHSLVFIEQDVCSKVNYTGKINYIIHAASQASPKYYGTDPVGTLNANVTGTLNMLELARANDVDAFLFFSSAEVYGQTPDIAPGIKEDDYGYLDPTKVRSCYAESKRMGENLCVSYAHQFNIKTKILRPFHTFGPGMDLNDGRVFVDFVRDIHNGNNIIMKSDGSAKRAYCYITDAVAAYFKVLLQGVTGKPYNVGNPDNEYSVLELATLLVAMFSDKKLNVLKANQPASNAYLASSVSRIIPNIDAVKLLNWTPNISVEDGFYKTILSYTHSHEGI